MACPACRCPLVCLGLKTYCRWAAETPPDPIRLRNICDASRRRRAQPVDIGQVAAPVIRVDYGLSAAQVGPCGGCP
jgi:hypothetical protein